MGNPQRTSSPPPRRLDPTALATLGGVIALLAVSYWNLREIDRVENALGSRLGKIETRLGQVADKVASAGQAAPNGPDPSRVYSLNLAGSPAKGPATAPVTIAEFSDFQ